MSVVIPVVAVLMTVAVAIVLCNVVPLFWGLATCRRYWPFERSLGVCLLIVIASAVLLFVALAAEKLSSLLA